MNSTSTDSSQSGIFYLLRALNSRNYRLFFSGQSISLIGSWMTRVAMAWLVYRLTNSALMLGMVGFAGQIPAFFLAPVAGVWIDRLDRRKMLVITQALAMIQSLALAGLALLGIIQIWQIIGLALFQGFINSFDMPARQAFVVQMVEDKNDLSNAIALNSSMVNLARMIGPTIAGAIIAITGEGWCFFLDGVSYIAVIISLLLMHITASEVIPTKKGATFGQLREGWKYVSTFMPIRTILVLLSVIALMGMPYRVLLPVYAKGILGGDSLTLGLLFGGVAVGAFTGAMLLASRRSVLGLGRLIPTMAAIFGGGLILFAVSRTIWISLPLMVIVGFGGMLVMASSNTMLQTIVDEDKRGRVMSFYTMAVMGMMPFGSLLSGALAHSLGITWTMTIGGASCLAGSVWFVKSLPTLRHHVRPIYQEKGILPAVAEGIEKASEMATPPEG
jgi:MFS family permease